MTNEAVKVELTNGDGFPRRYTCADGVAITKGTLCKLTDPRTASACDTANAVIAGIASMGKEASDGATSITCWTDGIFEMIASGSITVGAPLIAWSDSNYVSMGLGSVSSGAQIIGYALETATDEEVINVRIRV